MKRAGRIALSLRCADSYVCQFGCWFLLTYGSLPSRLNGYCCWVHQVLLALVAQSCFCQQSLKWVQLVACRGISTSLGKVLVSLRVKYSVSWKILLLLILLDNQKRGLSSGAARKVDSGLCWSCKHSFCLAVLKVADMPLVPPCHRVRVSHGPPSACRQHPAGRQHSALAWPRWGLCDGHPSKPTEHSLK